MTQKLTILFDLDGTLADTAPDLMKAHNYVMKKFGYSSRSMDEIRNLVGKGAAVMIGRSIWGSARKELSKISDDKIKKEISIGFHHPCLFFLTFKIVFIGYKDCSIVSTTTSFTTTFTESV